MPYWSSSATLSRTYSMRCWIPASNTEEGHCMSLFKSRRQRVKEIEERVASAPLVRTPAQQAWRRFRKNRLAMTGAGLLIFLVLFVFIGSVVTPYAPDRVDLMNIRAMPSLQHPLGCDDIGRDLLTRLLFGGRISLAVGLFSALLSMTLGTLIGTLAGYFGKWIDALLMDFTDVVLTIPTLPLLMVVGAVFKPSPTLLVVMISLLHWTTTARLVRSRFLTLRT
ncbi:MAG: ABC transporter permease, partial [Clostridiales bacterium]|nr:ABC transporter permease [Clostridiales bacterium]